MVGCVDFIYISGMYNKSVSQGVLFGYVSSQSKMKGDTTRYIVFKVVACEDFISYMNDTGII
jgi:hypothetical protein